MTTERSEPGSNTDRRGSGLFWVLLALAATAFAPCVILPAWRDYQSTLLAEQAERHRRDHMQHALDRQRALAEALRTDRAVIARAAQRELEYSRPGDVQVPVAPDPSDPEQDAEPFVATPVEPPAPVRFVVDALPQLDYDAVFCDGSTRTLVMILAGGLGLAAFALFPPGAGRPQRPEPRSPETSE